MSRKLYNHKSYNLTNGSHVEGDTQNTSYGFRHLATIYDKNYQKIGFGKACYYNRTWERYCYETVISRAIEDCELIKQKTRAKNKARDQALGNIKKEFAFIGNIAKLGEVLEKTKKGKNDWKKRMLKAGLGNKGLSFPEDWDTLSEAEKEKRLNKVIKELN